MELRQELNNSKDHPAKKSEQAIFLNFPVELLYAIFRLLPVGDLGNIAITCSKFNQASSHNFVWKEKLLQKNPRAKLDPGSSFKDQYKFLTMKKKSYPGVLFKTRANLTVKFVLVGNTESKKSQILYSYIGNLPNTIGIDFGIKKLQISGQEIQIQVWDTAGQERYKATFNSYTKNADGVFLVFNHENQGSFKDISKWYELCNQHFPAHIPKMLIGVCNDKEKSTVDEQEIKKLSEELDLTYYCVNTDTGVNINEIFDCMLEKLLNSQTEPEPTTLPSNPKNTKQRECRIM